MAERIHHEIDIEAAPARVYQALTDGKTFAEMTGGRPAKIEAKEGGAFSLFDGMISGRNVELSRDRRVVQAWRAGNWPEGTYSIVRFELTQAGKGTRIVFDHAGYPEGEDGHLDPGWHANYWEPMQAYLT